MLNLSCVICAELFNSSDDAYVTTCGHVFHNLCLQRWIERSKTCPQCRNKCSNRNILKLYFNVANNLDSSRLDATSLQDQLDNANFQLKIKENELKQTKEQNQELKATQKKCMKTITALEEKVNKNDFLIRSQQEQMKMIKLEANAAVELRNEIKELKLIIEQYNNISTLISSSMQETDKLLQKERDATKLSTMVSVLKRELQISENKKNDMRNVLKEVQNDLRKERAVSKKHIERISQLESENYQLNEKVNSSEKNSSVSNNFSNVIEEQRKKRITISPAIKDIVKNIQESNSPYLNIKSSSIGLTLLHKLNSDVGKSNTLSANTTSEASNCGSSNAQVSATNNALSKKYSIFKKPRIGLTTNILPAKQKSNYVFNGYGGSEKVSIFDVSSDVDDEVDEAAERKRKLPLTLIKPKTVSLNHRLKTGVLRDFQISKNK